MVGFALLILLSLPFLAMMLYIANVIFFFMANLTYLH